MKKRMIFVIILLLIIFGGTFGFDIFRSIMIKHFFKEYKPPSVTISTQKAILKTWNPTLTAVGNVTAMNGVEVNSQLPGQIIAIYFEDGQAVTKDTPLVRLDDSIDQQTLNNDLAQLNLDQVNYQRQLSLYQTHATAKSALDTAVAQLKQSEAQVASARVTIARKLIRAPFNGVLGIRQVNLGEYVNAGQAMVLLQQMEPIYVDFSLPEQDIRHLKVGQEVYGKVTAFPQKKLKGTITALNSSVDVNTRSITVRAKFLNTERLLYPGVFSKITVLLPIKENVVTVPQTAVTYSLYGDTVYVVRQKGKDKQGKPILVANQKMVNIGDSQDDVVAIKKGIRPGDLVVTSGQLKLRNGVEVKINNAVLLNGAPEKVSMQ